MRWQRAGMVRCGLLAFCALAWSLTALADDEPSRDQTRTAQPDQTRHRYAGYDRWEDGLDVKLTSLYTRKAADVSSPTVILTAQWNYKFPTETYIGLAASALPQAHTETVDGIKRSYSTYYGGLNLAQALFAADPYRLVVSVTGGKGLLYVRMKPTGEESTLGSVRYTVVEPSVWATFYEWSGLDLGAVVSWRIAKLDEKTERAEAKDLSSMSYGLTFRTQSQ